MISPSPRSFSSTSSSASSLDSRHDGSVTSYSNSSSSCSSSSSTSSSCSTVASQPLCEPAVICLPPSHHSPSHYTSPAVDKPCLPAGHVVIERALQKGNHGHVFLAHWQLPPAASTTCAVPPPLKRPRDTLVHAREDDEEEREECYAAGHERRRSGSPCAAVQESNEGARGTQRRRLEPHDGAAFVWTRGALYPTIPQPSIVSARSAHVAREVACLRYLQQQQQQPHYKTSSNDTRCTDALPCPRLYFALPQSAEAMALMTPSTRLRRALHRLRRRRPYFIAVELLGPDLFDFTGRYWLTEQELCVVAAGMLRTLRAVHRRGVVHRSVKPENFCWTLPGPSREDDSAGGGAEGLELKLIDYGRSTFPSAIVTDGNDDIKCEERHESERPYSGWWHSLHGFIGKRLGPKDDLMGIVHTVGFLLDDFGREAAREHKAHTSRHPEHYASCRRVLSDRILDAYAAYYAAEDEQHHKSNDISNKAENTAHSEWSSSSSSTGSVSSHYFARATRRPSAAALAHMERHVLPRLLPDTYYPAHLPAWWKAWYGECSTMHVDGSVTAEDMAEKMHEVLMRRAALRGREGAPEGEGEGLHVVREDVAELVQRYLARHATTSPPR